MSNDGTIISARQEKGPLNKALYFDGIRSYVDVGNTSETIKTVELLVKVAGNNKLIDFDGGTNTLETSGGNVLATGWDSPTYYVDSTPTDAITNGWRHIVVTTETGISVSDLDIGRVGSTYGESTINYLRMYEDTKTQNEVNSLYKQYATLPYFVDDFADSNESVAAETEFLSNTNWVVNSGSFSIARDETNKPREKVIECVTDGILYQEPSQAFGTWEFSFNKTAGGVIQVYFMQSEVSLSSGTGYSIYLGGTETIALTERGVGTKCATTAGYYSDSTWYSLRITRRHDGEFTLYIKGGSFTDWTLVDTTGGSGTNPVTDNTTTSSKYLVIDLDSGDMVSNFKFYQGVIT